MIEFRIVKDNKVVGTLDVDTLTSSSPTIQQMVTTRRNNGWTDPDIVKYFSDWSNGYLLSRRVGAKE